MWDPHSCDILGPKFRPAQLAWIDTFWTSPPQFGDGKKAEELGPPGEEEEPEASSPHPPPHTATLTRLKPGGGTGPRKVTQPLPYLAIRANS